MTTTETTTTESTKPKKSVLPYFFGLLLFLLILGAYGGLFWLWQSQNTQAQEVTQSVKQTLSSFQGDSQQGLAVAKQADERSVALQAKTLLLEEKITQALDQQTDLQALMTKMQTNKADTVISEVEQLVKVADQQVKFSGNIKAAVMALTAADLPLAQLGTSDVIDIREALGNDLQQLKEFPDVDMAALSEKLSSLKKLIVHLPLLQEQNALVDHEMPEEVVQVEANENPTIQARVWAQIKEFIMIEKIDAKTQPLISQEQKFYLQENLKLRLLTARIALMQRNAEVYKADLEAIRLWLSQYYDTQHPNAEKAIALLDELQETELGVALPNVQASLDAISQYQFSKEAAQ